MSTNKAIHSQAEAQSKSTMQDTHIDLLGSHAASNIASKCFELSHASSSVTLVLRWLVSKDLLNLCKMARCEAPGHINRKKGLFQLLGFGGTQKHSAHILILETPSDGQLRH
mmetsp:Transcript_102629/g.193073  ORF Transcript_102629/g.193073 Transcript_102629/m.193073 type:complete len:112 (+) Transcript_102629:298-633(+)